MIAGPEDARTPDARTPNAPVWTGRPGWVVYAVTSDPEAAAGRAADVAAEHRAPLAPGTWPVDAPADTHRIAVGPVYVAVRTRQGHANGAPHATYYVLRRWVADEVVQAADPGWPTPERPAAPAGAGAPWPFARVGHRTTRGGAKTFRDEPFGADVITWRGRIATADGPRTITFSTQPRKIDAHASFEGTGVSANARIHYATLHPEFIDVLVHHPLGAAERAALAALAQAHDTRPIVVRCVGERLRGEGAPRAARRPDGAQLPLPGGETPGPDAAGEDAPRG